MSYGDPFGRRPEKPKPKIWSAGGQRPPFDLRALGRASLLLSRLGVAPLHAWTARTLRRVAINVKNGVGRVPSDALAGAARFLPSHLRVAGWIKTLGSIAAHAGATTDPDIKRGNALVAEIEPHLWDPITPEPPVPPAPEPAPPVETAPVTLPVTPPVTLPEPKPTPPDYDPLASIREKLAHEPQPGAVAPDERPDRPDLPPDPPGPLAETAIQIAGYLFGWGTAILALPYGLIRALWLYLRGVDLRGLTAED